MWFLWFLGIKNLYLKYIFKIVESIVACRFISLVTDTNYDQNQEITEA